MAGGMKGIESDGEWRMENGTNETKRRVYGITRRSARRFYFFQKFISPGAV